MKFKVPNGDDKIIFWSDHAPGCAKCCEVDLDKTSTFVNACAYPGAPLLNEEIKKRQAPVAHAKAEAVRKWAEGTGGFKMGGGVSKDKLKQITKYVGE